MQKHKLGNTGLEVSPLCLGGNVFGWTADEKTSFEVLDAFVDRGFNFVETADVYSKWIPGNHGGESETVIGRWFKRSGKREQVILATKVGWRILDALDQIANQYNATPAQISLAWLMARPGITAPIASATSTKQLDELLAAATLKLDASAIEYLNKASAPAHAAHAE